MIGVFHHVMKVLCADALYTHLVSRLVTPAGLLQSVWWRVYKARTLLAPDP